MIVHAWRRPSRAAGAVGAAGAALLLAATATDQRVAGARQSMRWLTDLLAGRREGRVDQTLDGTFPASDAPSWTPTTGTGLRHKM
jgi:hypothetical protein